jgi:hypothetical protein
MTLVNESEAKFWIHNKAPFDISIDEILKNGYHGFVYIITNVLNGRSYIGKKGFLFSKTKTVKGKKKRIKVESDWKSYYGSNSELQEDVIKQGKENFIREILHLCKTKSECSYREAKEQFDRGVLMSDKYYNSWIMVRVHKKHIKFELSC